MTAYRKRPYQFLIALEGMPFVLIPLLLGVFFKLFLVSWALYVFIPLSLAVALFFRNPARNFPRGEMFLLSPADGRVISTAEFEDKKLISIFMSVANVHINRMPCSGMITNIIYKKGKFNIAHKNEAGAENEQNVIEFEDRQRRRYRMAQIAGFVARRIVCYYNKGDLFEQGERAGLIMFGSRVDLFFPREFEVAVRPGQSVRGGETVIGRIV